MVIKNFDELIEKVQSFEGRKKVAVAAAHDEHAMEAVFHAAENNIVEPVFIGYKEKIKEIAAKLGKTVSDDSIIETADDLEAAAKAVELARNGQVDFIMKGKLQTADLLRAVVDKEKGLRTGKVMSHVSIQEVPSYHKLLITTDGGMMMYPDLEQKKKIIENAVEVLHSLGYENPKVAVLAAVETVNPKMPESVDAGKLKEMNQNGEITGCIVEGPISYDIAMNKESGEIKGFVSPVAGDPDILIVPNITCGNILGKCLVYSAGAKMAGFIVGAKVPIVLTSRGSSSEEKYLSLVLSAAAS
jgi:phosphate butyryltransferase